MRVTGNERTIASDGFGGREVVVVGFGRNRQGTALSYSGNGYSAEAVSSRAIIRRAARARG